MLGRSLWVQRGVVLCVSRFPGPSLPLMPLVAFRVSKQRGRFDRFYRVLVYHVMGQMVDSWKAVLNHSNLQIFAFISPEYSKWRVVWMLICERFRLEKRTWNAVQKRALSFFIGHHITPPGVTRFLRPAFVYWKQSNIEVGGGKSLKTRMCCVHQVHTMPEEDLICQSGRPTWQIMARC